MNILENKVRKICKELVAKEPGWKTVIEEVSKGQIDITSNNFNFFQEFDVDRSVSGFGGFFSNRSALVVPGYPEKCVLFHAFASPEVIHYKQDGQVRELKFYPTTEDIETLENYVYSSCEFTQLNIKHLKDTYGPENVRLVTFSSQYRQKEQSVTRAMAEMCYSRTGISRVGTDEGSYDSKLRSYRASSDEENIIRIRPAKYSLFIAIKKPGDALKYGPMDLKEKDRSSQFWIPYYKIFPGTECIKDLDLEVNFIGEHFNEKLYRIHKTLGDISKPSIVENNSFVEIKDIKQPPFKFSDDIAKITETGWVMPIAHPLVEPATFKGAKLTYFIPKAEDSDKTGVLSSSLLIHSTDGARLAPEYVHARTKVLENGEEMDLNEFPDVAKIVADGNYNARHYIDHTADGWVKGQVKINGIAPDWGLNEVLAAYSIVTAPNFYPKVTQEDLLDWWNVVVPRELQDYIWNPNPGAPQSLSRERVPVNLTLGESTFTEKDKTLTAIVTQYREINVDYTDQNRFELPEINVPSYLPDTAAGVFAPGWDTSIGSELGKGKFLAAYGLGSPFPEDAKLCAALGSYWPAAAPDATQTLPRAGAYHTTVPQTDEEVGITGSTPWDGINGPEVINNVARYTNIDYGDYILNAQAGKISLVNTSKVDAEEYICRIIAMVRVYLTLELTVNEKWKLGILSFKLLSADDKEVMEAIKETQAGVSDKIYRFDVFIKGDTNDQDKYRKIDIKQRCTILISREYWREKSAALFPSTRVLVKKENGSWLIH